MRHKRTLLINPIPNIFTSTNKDLNGGYRTSDKIGKNLLSLALGYAKKRNIKIPVLCMGYISSILNDKEIKNSYFENCENVISFLKSNEVSFVYYMDQ